MGLKKNRVKKENYSLQESRLFGIIENVAVSNHVEKTRENSTIPSNCEARRQALAPIIEAEYWKAQAITLICQKSYT